MYAISNIFYNKDPNFGWGHGRVTASMKRSLIELMLYRISFENLSIVSMPLDCFFMIVCTSVLKLMSMSLALFFHSDTHLCEIHVYVIGFVLPQWHTYVIIGCPWMTSKSIWFALFLLVFCSTGQ
jgi:hypothetical protein